MTKTAVSAPGKVFLAGGYLVLDRHYTALVFALSARIHVLVQDIDTTSGVELSEIIVESPQFREAVWRYGYRQSENGGGIEVTQLQDSLQSSQSSNPFVETALTYALTYIASITKSHTIKPSHITILADDDYYSNPGTPVSSSTSKSQTPTPQHTFSTFSVRLPEAHKTGLGSSAALVTAFTAALLCHYLPPSTFSLPTLRGADHSSQSNACLRILHNLAQTSHCAAQGKVGSGFDIATAVHGSCIYRRFSPSILSSLDPPGSAHFAERLRSLVEDPGHEAWDVAIHPDGAVIPRGYALRMCDVDAGTQTVGMVKRVLAWRAAQPEESTKIWDELQGANVELAKQLSSPLSQIAEESLRKSFRTIRGLIQAMSKASGVPIEPVEQTALLDAVTGEVDGVVGGVVPGAGGYDAIVLLVRDDEGTEERLKEWLEGWSAKVGSKVRLLEVRGEMEGVGVEPVEGYDGEGWWNRR